MTRAIRNILLVLILPIVLLFFAGAIGERLGNWTDNQPRHATLTWIASDAALLALGISVIWFLRRRRRRSQ